MLALLATAMCLVACTTPEEPPAVQPVVARRIVPADEAANDGTFVLGAALAQTGVLAAEEQPVLDALRAAVDRQNAQGGIAGAPVALRVADTGSSLTTATSAAAELTDGGADALIVGCDVDVASTVARMARRAGRLAVSTCAGDDAFGVDTAGNLGFSFAAPVSSRVDAVVARLAASGATSLVTVSDLVPYESTAACQRVVRAFRANGGTVLAEIEIGPGDTVERVAARAARVGAPSALVSCLGRASTGPVLRALRDAGVGAPITALGAADELPWAGGVDEVVFASVADPIRPGPDLEPLVAAGARSGPAIVTFVALDVLARAAATAGGAGATAIAEVLRTATFPTPIGALRFDPRQRATGHSLVFVRTVGETIEPAG